MLPDGTTVVNIEGQARGWSVTVTGHPHEALQRGHRVLDLLFSGRWSIVSVKGRKFGPLNSDFTLTIFGEYNG